MKDNFSAQAKGYLKYRPEYPVELFEFILGQVKGREAAWDCATGNGQTARALSPFFKKIYATDISRQQLDNAYTADNIDYSMQPAERTNLPENAVDLITVSQALHWFNFDAFYKEAERVGNPGSMIAVWMYSLLRISTVVDAIIDHYHFNTLQNFWDDERKYVDANYTNIPFPFPELATPMFAIEYYWTLDQLEGYLNTWSALQNFLETNQQNPVPGLIEEIRPLWEEEKMRVIFPLHLRMGKIKQ